LKSVGVSKMFRSKIMKITRIKYGCDSNKKMMQLIVTVEIFPKLKYREWYWLISVLSAWTNFTMI